MSLSTVNTECFIFPVFEVSVFNLQMPVKCWVQRQVKHLEHVFNPFILQIIIFSLATKKDHILTGTCNVALKFVGDKFPCLTLCFPLVLIMYRVIDIQ